MFTTAQKGRSITQAIVEVAKALGGSFKLVMLAPKTCKGDDSTSQGNIKEWGHTNKSKSISEHWNGIGNTSV